MIYHKYYIIADDIPCIHIYYINIHIFYVSEEEKKQSIYEHIVYSIHT